MPKPLRKTLGAADAPETLALMALIDTQSRETICQWCLDVAQERLLPVFERRQPGDDRPRRALEAARNYLAGKVKFPQVKQIILKECHQAARELDLDPASQAAARACGQAAAVVHTLTHSLGLLFYGAAALAYDELGLEGTAAEYTAFAARWGQELLSSLQAVAVADEPQPAKLKWYC